MSDNPLWLVSFLISTFFSFFSVAFIVEIAIRLFRIKKHRARSIVRFLPMISLAFDVFFSKLSTGNLINPLYCESCIQKIFFHFKPEYKRYLAEHQISWSKYLASQMPDVFFTAFFLIFGFISAVILIRKIVQILLISYSIHNLIEQCKPCNRKIENCQLSSALRRQRAKVFVSDAILSPMAVCWRTILIPKNSMNLLLQDEFEAVVSHELEHLRWKDPILKLGCQIVSTVFWWVPTRWWLKRMDQDQEMSADASIRRYSIDGTALASALVKIAGRQACSDESVALCSLAVAKVHLLLARLRMTLDPAAVLAQRNSFLPALFGLATISIIILSCLL